MANKSVIYIDVEDDITAVIGKLKAADAKVVALVPPKRTAVLTSLVNLKLLKKAAGDKNKQLVLVTADDTIRSLAGGVGIYVATNLTSPPEVPEVTGAPDLPSDVIESAGEPTIKEVSDSVDEPGIEEISELEDTSPIEKAGVVTGLGALKDKFKKLKPFKKDKQLPDFNRFKKRIFIAVGLLVLLLIFWWYAVFIAPTAQVKLQGQTNRITSEFELIADTEATEANLEEKRLPAERQELEITQTAETSATGEKNIGNKATGTITIENCLQSESMTLTAGTRIRHSSGLIYRTTEAVTVPGASFFITCNSPGVEDVPVTADQPGDNYNIAATTSTDRANDSYQIVNFSTTENNGVLVNGSEMSGGTSNVVKVVSDKDVETAKAKFADEELDSILDQLKGKFDENIYLFEDSLKVKDSEDTLSTTVGKETEKLTITRKATYAVVGAQRDVYEKFLQDIHGQQIGEQQVVQNTGIDEAIIELVSDKGSEVKLDVSVNGLAGPNIDIAVLQQQLAKKAYTEAIAFAETLDGINKADIELSPFWVSKMPRNPNKISIEVVVTDIQQ